MNETEIAKERIKEINSFEKNGKKDIEVIAEVLGIKQSCQRFLEFLGEFAENLILGKRKRGQHKYNKIDIRDKIKDLKNAIKIYKENGI